MNLTSIVAAFELRMAFRVEEKLSSTSLGGTPPARPGSRQREPQQGSPLRGRHGLLKRFATGLRTVSRTTDDVARCVFFR